MPPRVIPAKPTIMNGSPAAAGMSELLALAARESAAGSERPAGAPSGGSVDLREWTQAIRAGDEAAFTRFYELYNLRLYKHLLVLARGNEGEAREVLQTVVVKVAKGCKVFDQEQRLWGWLCRVARNAYVDLCRARRRDERFVPLEDHAAGLTAARAGQHRLAASLHQALEQLTADERELMRAAYVDERPLQELADASGQSYKAVESRLSRLRRKLKASLLHHLRHEVGA